MDADHKRRMIAGLRRSAIDRAQATRCPKCGRKSSLKQHTEHFSDGDFCITTWCWRDGCGYQRESWRYGK